MFFKCFQAQIISCYSSNCSTMSSPLKNHKLSANFLRVVLKMADYWDEHGANEDEYIEDIFDFIRRLNSGQLPSHWHLEDYADLRLPANVVRMLFDNNPGSQRKTSEWFIEEIEENDSFPGKLNIFSY